MTDLVNELHEEHNYIKELLEKIRAKGITSDDGKTELFRVKDLLLSHIKKEDEKLYPVLKEYAEKEIVKEGSMVESPANIVYSFSNENKAQVQSVYDKINGGIKNVLLSV
ncbi:MAG: hemerythrin domain-containing protein [Nanoarchaeota archaeon]